MNEEEMQKLRATEIEILDFVVEVCSANNLNYYLLYGTLLGAVRHEGFIPWDDDIDIGLPRKDYDRLCTILTQKCNGHSKFCFQDCDADIDFNKPYSKVRKRNTIFQEEGDNDNSVFQGIFIDIFPLDYVNNRVGLQKLFSFMVFRLLGVKGKNRRINISISKKILTWYKWGMYYVVYGSPYSVEKDVHNILWFGDGRSVVFEGKKYNAPEKYEEYLSQIYGDYMKLPPVEKRISHNPKLVKFGEV